MAWIRYFLHNCSQSDKIHNVSYEWRQVLSGVPQRSVLGPYVLVICINDIIKNSKFEVYPFADDMKIFRPINDENIDISCLQNDVDLVDQWTHTWSWLLKLNPNICKQESPAYKLAYGEMQYAITLEMKYKCLRYSHTLARPPFCPPSWNL